MALSNTIFVIELYVEISRIFYFGEKDRVKPGFSFVLMLFQYAIIVLCGISVVK